MKISWKAARRASFCALCALFLASCADAKSAATTTQKTKAKAPARKAPGKTKPAAKAKKEVPPVLNFTMKNLGGKNVPLSSYNGKVVMIVNTASKCGLTPQYKGLQKLHEKYAKQGLAILGFPANDFGNQEPGSDTEIDSFCRVNYGVSFPMFSKVAVLGEKKAPLYQYLTSEKTNPKFAGDITWNFEKFLIGRNGEILARFKPAVAPDAPEVIAAIEAALKS